MKNLKHHIAMFYVALILLFKVGGLHALTHYHADDTDVQHCEVCHITTAVNFIPLLDVEIAVLSQPEYFFLEQKVTNNASNIVYSNGDLSSYFCTRPPPQDV